jgi:hypothetical protein
MRKIFLFQLLWIISFATKAQIGGRSSYQFLHTVSSPKLAALSGVNVSHLQSDLEMVYFNPSLLDSTHNLRADVSYTNYLSDINYGFAAYSFSLKKYGQLALGAKYINYGDFIEANVNGDITGNFSAAETAFFIAWSKKYIQQWSYGINLKLVNSNFYQYASVGLLADAGISWTHKSKLTRIGLVANNMGTMLSTYSENNFESLPFDIRLGITKKLPHAPLRFSLTAHNLQNPNFWYESPNNKNNTDIFGLNDSETEVKTPWGEAILRHLTLGTELILSENFQLQMGYHHQRRAELKLRDDSRGGAVGFSFGFSMRIKKFHFNYARSVYHLAGATNHIGVSIKLSDFTSSAKTSKE